MTEQRNYFNQAQYDWLVQKLGKISSSKCSKLFVGSRNKKDMFGDGAITYLYELLDEMTTGEPKEEMDFKQTEWGKANEMDAILCFENKTGLHVNYHGISAPLFVKWGDYAGGSPDGEVQEVVEDAICECKCHYNGSIHAKKLVIGSVKEFETMFYEEYCQDQMNMLVTGKKNCYSISYDPRKKEKLLQLKIIKVPASEEWQEEFKIRHDAAVNFLAEKLDMMYKNLFIQ